MKTAAERRCLVQKHVTKCMTASLRPVTNANRIRIVKSFLEERILVVISVDAQKADVTLVLSGGDV